jgi:hypothetical protein
MRPHLMEGHLHLPPQDKPLDDLGGADRLIGAEQCLGRKLGLQIMEQNPTGCATS